MMTYSYMLTGVPSLSKLSKKYFTDSPWERQRAERISQVIKEL